VAASLPHFTFPIRPPPPCLPFFSFSLKMGNERLCCPARLRPGKPGLKQKLGTVGVGKAILGNAFIDPGWWPKKKNLYACSRTKPEHAAPNNKVARGACAREAFNIFDARRLKSERPPGFKSSSYHAIVGNMLRNGDGRGATDCGSKGVSCQGNRQAAERAGGKGSIFAPPLLSG